MVDHRADELLDFPVQRLTAVFPGSSPPSVQVAILGLRVGGRSSRWNDRQGWHRLADRLMEPHLVRQRPEFIGESFSDHCHSREHHCKMNRSIRDMATTDVDSYRASTLSMNFKR